MATINAATKEKTISVKQFLGLNENPDGDNKLKTGEAVKCQNFKVTNSGNLMKRFGTSLMYTLGEDTASISKTSATITSPTVDTSAFKEMVKVSGTYVFTYDTDHWVLGGETVTISDYGISYSGAETDEDKLTVVFTLGIDKPIMGMWHGFCSHHELFIVACGGHLWMLQDDDMKQYPTDLGAISTDNDVFMFGFDEQVFMLNGTQYGHVYYQSNPTPATATATTVLQVGSTLASVAVDKDVFAAKVGGIGGGYQFYKVEDGWGHGLSDVVDLTEYGVTYSGTPLIGDIITVFYTVASLGSWVYENLATGTGGYRPLVAIAIPPNGGGELLEQVNKLNGMRRVTISPDGVNASFQMPEKELASIDYVIDVTDPEHPLAPGALNDYDYDLTDGTVTFTTAPALGVESYEIGYSVSTHFAGTIGTMRYAEMYAGTQDTRLFIYGNGTNHSYYSGIDYNGHARGDYFPDLNEVTVGDSNTPITGLIRHYTKLLAFKPEQTFSIDYGVVTLADGLLTPAFYTTPVNRIIGNEALGQVQLVLNAPISLCKGNLYEWRNGSSYAANVSIDERQAKIISDRIYHTLHQIDFSKVHCFDDNLHTEYYIIDENGDALVHNYTVDAWYTYTGVDARLLMLVGNDIYIGTKSGKILLLDEKRMSDEGRPIDCYWESGSMDFGASYMRKYSALMWVGVKADLKNAVTVTVKTDRSEENTEVEIEPEYEFEIPKITRAKVKVKKFVYYKLIFKSTEANSRVTVVDTEIKVRFTAQAK